MVKRRLHNAERYCGGGGETGAAIYELNLLYGVNTRGSRMCENLSLNDITLLIDNARNGDVKAENALCERVFQELYRIAKRMMPNDDTSLQPTMLVHDLWVKLFSNGGLKKTENRRYFFTVAADQMRKTLIDHYRRKKRQRVGGDRKREPFEIVIEEALEGFESKNGADFAALNYAIEKLKTENERLYQVVIQRYFAGLTIKETAHVLGVSGSSVDRDWRLARAKLFSELKEPRE